VRNKLEKRHRIFQTNPRHGFRITACKKGEENGSASDNQNKTGRGIIMPQEIVLDRALYKKIKAMDKQQMQNFLVSLYNNAQTDMNAASVDLTELRNEIGAIRGIGENRLNEIMSVIEKHLAVEK